MGTSILMSWGVIRLSLGLSERLKTEGENFKKGSHREGNFKICVLTLLKSLTDIWNMHRWTRLQRAQGIFHLKGLKSWAENSTVAYHIGHRIYSLSSAQLERYGKLSTGTPEGPYLRYKKLCPRKGDFLKDYK